MSNRNRRSVLDDAEDDDNRGNQLEEALTERNQDEDSKPYVPQIPMWDDDDTPRESER